MPAAYGGFETLAENLVDFVQRKHAGIRLAVYCSGKTSTEPKYYKGAELRYVRLNANGVSSIAYDLLSMFSALRRRDDAILLLGVSGAIGLPLFKLLSPAKVVTNIDGIEWKREKWRGVAKRFLRLSEALAVRFSDVVIADNEGIAEHVRTTYNRDCEVIAYGGDHSVSIAEVKFDGYLPETYALALCRIEPENNIEMILEAYAHLEQYQLVFIGNWSGSEFGKSMKKRFSEYNNIQLIDPIYDVAVLKHIRKNASLYIHGHSAGGTNPSLVEMMHFRLPVLAYDCVFNRYSTEEQALYFKSASGLRAMLVGLSEERRSEMANAMQEIARRRYTWEIIGSDYLKLLLEN